VNWFGSNNGFSDYNFPSVLAADSVVIAGSDAHGVYMSRNYGTTWNQISQLGTTSSSYSFRYDSERIYLLTSQGLCYSTNKGITWNIMSVPVFDASNNFCPRGDIIFLGTNQGIYKTTNFGVNWIRSDNGIPSYYIFSNCIFTNNNFGLVQIWNLSAEYVMYKTTNNGANWSLIQNPGGAQNMLTYLVENQNILYAGTEHGLYTSTNSGNNWVQASNGLPSIPVEGFVFRDNFIYVAMGSTNVFRSTDNGLTWQSYNEGITTGVLRSMTSGGPYLFASGEGVFYIRNFQTDIRICSGSIPDKFSLSQNYPNPFNPATSIKYSVSSIQSVKLSIYNILGKEVETLVNEKQSAGTYEVNWNASNYPSGIYFYRLQAGDFTETKKMILIK